MSSLFFKAVLVTALVLVLVSFSSAQNSGQYIGLITQGSDNTSLIVMSLPKFDVISSRAVPIKKKSYLHPHTVNRNENIIYYFSDNVLYTINRKTLTVGQGSFNENIIKMEYNPKDDTLIALIQDGKRYLIKEIARDGSAKVILETNYSMNQTFTPSTLYSNSALDYTRQIFYLSINDGAWIPGHNRILKFDLKSGQISAILFENELSEYGDFDYDPALDVIVGVYFPVSSDNSVEFFTLDPNTSKASRFQISGAGLGLHNVKSYSSLNGYFYVLLDNGKSFVIDIKARKLVSSALNTISPNFDFLFGYYFD